MTRKEARVTSLWTRPAPSAVNDSGAQIGRIAAIDAHGAITVELLPSRRTSIAKLAVAVDSEQLQHALHSQQPVVVVFENGDLVHPIIVGFIAAPTPLMQPEPLAQVDEASQIIEADVDGKRVRIVAKDEIVFECGAASITLRRNGRVIIRGTHVESYSDGTNRIKGGQVRIN